MMEKLFLCKQNFLGNENENNAPLIKYILQGGVRWYANCAPRLRGSFRSSVSRLTDRNARRNAQRQTAIDGSAQALKERQIIDKHDLR